MLNSAPELLELRPIVLGTKRGPVMEHFKVGSIPLRSRTLRIPREIMPKIAPSMGFRPMSCDSPDLIKRVFSPLLAVHLGHILPLLDLTIGDDHLRPVPA
jgi:hypothetical protein